ncbi:unnamed protein product, partial [Allacma fusca]
MEDLYGIFPLNPVLNKLQEVHRCPMHDTVRHINSRLPTTCTRSNNGTCSRLHATSSF